MNDKEYYDYVFAKNNGCGSGMICAMIIAAIVLFTLFGCKTQYVPVETIKEVYITKHDSITLRDSIWQHDSVFVQMKGDTVLVEKWRTKYVEHLRDVVKVDSFIKRDSVQVPYPVARKLSFKERMYITIGKIVIWPTLIIILALIIYLALKFRRR